MSTRVRKEAFTLIELPAVRQRGFTLIELLVVIGIIAVLMGLLLPVINKMRWASYQANTAALVANLSAATQRYYEDFRAYPGPIPNADLNKGAPIASIATYTWPTGYDNSAPPFASGKVTGAENLVLGLCGGLSLNGANISYDPSNIGKGPGSLNSANPKTYPVYAEAANLTPSFMGGGAKTGAYKDDAGTANDSSIPEFVDRYPDPIPILYLRAKVGVANVSTGISDSNNSVFTDGTGTRSGPYDLSQIIAYTGTTIGVGKGLKASDYKSATYPQHGLRSVASGTATLDAATQYPFTGYAYFRDQTAGTVSINQPRAKDMYILISAGPDRVYGTSDDITSFGAVQP